MIPYVKLCCIYCAESKNKSTLHTWKIRLEKKTLSLSLSDQNKDIFCLVQEFLTDKYIQKTEVKKIKNNVLTFLTEQRHLNHNCKHNEIYLELLSPPSLFLIYQARNSKKQHQF